ncbi:MAG: hypothetical protein WD845_18335 [Pirellulales bacterium]
MPIETRWLASATASCWHAAEAIARGAELVDRATHDAMVGEVDELLGEVRSLGLDQDFFFACAVPAAVQLDVPAEWAKAVLSRLVGVAPAPDAAQRLARRFVALQAAFLRTNPQVLDELELRTAPLMGQWEARGPGLLAGVARLTEPELIVERADVIAVHPVLGGGGAAHWLYNSVRIEAVLANPIAQLPEVLRLGWLLAQLQLELPKFDANLRADRRAEVWRLAMIPPVLAAAEEVELARYGPPSLAAALSAWTDDLEATAAGTLATWWDTYAATSASWPAALAALDRLLLAD